MKKNLYIFLMLIFASNLFAKAPSEIQSSDTISSQLVNKEGVSSPYMVTGESLVGLLKELVNFEIEGSSIVFHRKTGKLFVKNTPKNQKLIINIIAQLRNYKARQVMIEARIIEVSSFDGLDIGIDWTNIRRANSNGKHTVSGAIDLPNGSWGNEALTALSELNLTYGLLKGSNTLNVTLTALEKNGKINTLSAPRIICFDNQRANIKIETSTDYVSKITTNTTYAGDNINVDTSTEVETAVEGIVLDVTPAINTDNKSITLDLHPEVVELVSLTDVTVGNNSIKVPKYVRRTADTSVSISDGGTIVIGGLMKRTENKDIRKVPFFGDIPLIKNLFRAETKYEEKSNLLIFITAKIKDE